MKNKFTVAAATFAAVGSLSAQSLFDLAPDDSETDSFPLRWTVGLDVGYDDNPTPFGADDSSLYANAYVGAALLNETPQTTFEFAVRLGVLHYFDDLDTANTDETSFNGGLTANWTHRVSDRLRLVSNNYVTYERNPDYTSGPQGIGQVGEYLRWYTDNALGYRWTDRLATYTGFSLNGLEYQDTDSDVSDRFSWSLYNNFRYQLSQQTVGTLNYRYSDVDGNGSTDSTRQYITAGIEHRLSPNTVFIAKAGVQLIDIDGQDSETSPHVELALRSKVNEAFSVSAYARYEDDDYNRVLNQTEYATSEAFRIGVKGSYRVSEPLTIHGGVNYYSTTYEDPFRSTLPAAGVLSSIDEDVINFNIGFSQRLSDGIFLTGNYNYTDYGSDIDAREDDRNRFSLGVKAEF